MITDPNGRLADLARHVVAETQNIIRDEESTPLNRKRATELQMKAKDIARWLDGYTEMPDAKRARGADPDAAMLIALKRVRNLEVSEKRYGYQNWFEQVRRIVDRAIDSAERKRVRLEGWRDVEEIRP